MGRGWGKGEQGAGAREPAGVSGWEANLEHSEKPIPALRVCTDAEGLRTLPIQDAVGHEGIVAQVWVLGLQSAHQGARPSCLHHRELVHTWQEQKGRLIPETGPQSFLLTLPQLPSQHFPSPAVHRLAVVGMGNDKPVCGGGVRSKDQ